MAGRRTDETANELRAVAPLVVGGAQRTLVGSCTLVTNGAHTIAFSSAELLRQAGPPLAIATTLDGASTVPVASWMMGRHPAIGIIELGAPFPAGTDIVPISLGGVCATIDTRGAPAALVSIEARGTGFARRIVAVHVDAQDGGAMSDDIVQLASPIETLDIDARVDGAALFAWLPADPVLGRASETVVVALGVPYTQNLYKPRDLPPIAELVGLEDLGRVLPWTGANAEPGNELSQVAGEIRDDKS